MTETEEKMRKNFYRQAQKGICIATLSATVLTRILCRGVCQGKGSYGRNAEVFPAYRKRSDF